MLVLKRNVNQRIKIGDDIWITVCAVGFDTSRNTGHARIGVEAPKDVAIHREEIALLIDKQAEAGKAVPK